jgi:predicted nicotinamide N-methyase
VLAADIDPISLAAVELNAAANGVAVATTADDLLAATPTDRDVLIVGDMFYERPLADRVLAFMEAAARRGIPSIVGDPQRSYFPRGRFAQVAHYEVPVTRDLEDAEIKRTAVWRFGPAD